MHMHQPPAERDSTDLPASLPFAVPHPDAAAQAFLGDTGAPLNSKRTSYRPPIPPKPAPHTASPAPPLSPVPPPVEQASDPPAKRQSTSPTIWMRAMAHRRDEAPSPPHPPIDGGACSGATTPRSARGSPLLAGGTSPSMTFPSRKSPRVPPAVPPRPVNLSSTPAARPEGADLLVDLQPAPSSCPPALSPFAAMNAADAVSSVPGPVPTITTSSPSRSPDRWRSSSSSSRPPQPHSSSSASISSSASYSSLNTATNSAFTALGRGLQQAKFRDRFGAGVGFAREWGGRGKGKVMDGWRGLQQQQQTNHRPGGSAGSAAEMGYALATPPGGGAASSSSPPPPGTQLDAPPPTAGPGSSAPGGASPLRLPMTVLGVRVPNARGLAFGVPLAPLVDLTRASSPPGSLPASSSNLDDPVTGSTARYWLPGVAFRALEYLEEWGPREEGIYRVPGRSHMVAQLRTLFDAGVGQDRDLREIHPADLDPAAVASLLKSWLREIHEPLLSHQLEATVDALTTAALGHPASSSHFLSGASSSNSPSSPSARGSPSNPSSPNPNSGGPVAPTPYLTHLSTLFASALPAENFYLLRAIAHHLARLAAHEGTNKMSLSNLRLILSPTLRLSPGFLQVLVVEREILFGQVNEDGRARRAADSALPPSSSSSASLNPPPLPRRANPAGDLPPSPSSRSLAADRWLVVDEPPLSLSPSASPSPSSATYAQTGSSSSTFTTTDDGGDNDFDTERGSLSRPTLTASSSGDPQQQQQHRTPIADRFASTSMSTSRSSLASSPRREGAPPPAATGPTPSAAAAQPDADADADPSRLSLGAEFRAALAGLEGPPAVAAPPAMNVGDKDAVKGSKKSRRESRAMGMPLGVGLGLVARPPAPGGIAEEDQEGEGATGDGETAEAERWALLSVEERRRLFGG